MTSTTISLRLDKRLLDLIDDSASWYRESRNTYILRHLPDYYRFADEVAVRNTDSGAAERPQDTR
jgi:hypothetical protein